MPARDRSGHSGNLSQGRKGTARWVLTAILYAATTLAGTPPPVVDESISGKDTSWRAKAKPVEKVTLGDLSIIFEQTNLQDVLAAVSIGAIDRQGDAADSVSWICYTLNDVHPSRVWIESYEEMGGPDRDITAIAVQEITDLTLSNNCPLLPAKYSRIAFGREVQLGMSESAIHKIFPLGRMHLGNREFLGYQGKVPGDCDGGYDLLNSLYLTFHHGRVVFMEAGQVTSC